MSAFLSEVEVRAFRMADISVRNRDDALDIVQDAMMSLVKRYADKPQEQWRPLFFRILNNAIIDFHRKQVVRRKVFGWLASNDEDGPPEAQAIDPVAEEGVRSLLRDERLERLELALQKLAPRQQQAFFLRCWEGFSTKETAQIMKCTQGSVKTHYCRALKSLQGEMEDLYESR